MKTTLQILGLIGLMAVSVLGEEYRIVRGDVIPRNSRDWTVLGGSLEVTSTSGRNLFCRCFTEQTVVGNVGGSGNARFTPTYRHERTYGETFVLTNYPNSGGYKRGDVIRGPLAAMRVGTTKWTGSVHSVYTSSSGSTSTYGEGGTCDLYDVGTPFVPAAKPLTAEQAKAVQSEAAKKAAAGAVATFKFHQERAENGDASSQFRLGQLYMDGTGVERDTNQARIWFDKAAAQGNTEATKALRRLCAN